MSSIVEKMSKHVMIMKMIAKKVLTRKIFMCYNAVCLLETFMYKCSKKLADKLFITLGGFYAKK